MYVCVYLQVVEKIINMILVFDHLGLIGSLNLLFPSLCKEMIEVLWSIEHGQADINVIHSAAGEKKVKQ